MVSGRFTCEQKKMNALKLLFHSHLALRWGNREQNITEDISSYGLGNYTDWRKLRYDKLHNLYCPSNNIRGDEMDGTYSRHRRYEHGIYNCLFETYKYSLLE